MYVNQPPINKIISSHNNGNNQAIIEMMLNQLPNGINQIDIGFANVLRKAGAKKAIKILHKVLSLAPYKADHYLQQNIKLPAKFIADAQKGITTDCKTFAMFGTSALIAAGYNAGFRFAGYNGEKKPSHVYTYLELNNGKKLILDGCVKNNIELNPTLIKDMTINTIAGINKEPGIIRVIDRVNTVNLAIPRNSFLLLVKLNVRKLGTNIFKAMQRPNSNTEQVWKRLGGDPKKLLAAASTGRNKPALNDQGQPLDQPFVPTQFFPVTLPDGTQANLTKDQKAQWDQGGQQKENVIKEILATRAAFNPLKPGRQAIGEVSTAAAIAAAAPVLIAIIAALGKDEPATKADTANIVTQAVAAGVNLFEPGTIVLDPDPGFATASRPRPEDLSPGAAAQMDQLTQSIRPETALTPGTSQKAGFEFSPVLLIGLAAGLFFILQTRK